MNRFLRTTLAIALILGTSSADAAAKRVKHPTPMRPAGHTGTVTVITGYRLELAPAGSLLSVWTQYGPGGVLEARAVVDGSACPELVLDLQRSAMQRRATSDDKFLTVCAAPIPVGTRQAALAFRAYKHGAPPIGAGSAALTAWAEIETGVAAPGANASDIEWRIWSDQVAAKAKYDLVPLPLPVADPQRILVFGDTGCRIKGKSLQDCSDPEAWPFARISTEAARLKPDLVIHVGDYLYRENACPAEFKGCTGTPFGDNWPTWDADFFAPAKPLLAAAPWVMLRGNHEDCQRAGPGFLRLLGPTLFDPAVPCADHLPQYTIPLAQMTLAVMDNADAPETSINDKSVPAYREEIAALAKEKAPVWWLQHRPIWAPITGPLGIPAGGNLTMMAAVDPAGIPPPVELMLAGHIHTFEAINYYPADHVPPQIVAGFGGDMLDPTPASLRGTIFQGSSGVHIQDGLSVGGFGFLLMTRTETGWTVDVYDPHGRIERQCSFQKGRVDCPKPRR